MDKNTWIGFALIAAIIVGFSFINRPSKEELAERQRIQDSIAVAKAAEWEAEQIAAQITQQLESEANSNTVTSEQMAQQVAAVYGAFAPATQGEEGYVTLENEKIRIAIAKRGGRVAKAELKEYKAYGDSINPLCLFQNDESSLSFTLVTNTNRVLATQNMYFSVANQSTDAEGNSTLTLTTAPGVGRAGLYRRYFTFADEQGPCGHATSLWTVIDLNKRAIVSPDQAPNVPAAADFTPALPSPVKVRRLDGEATVNAYHCQYTDADLNHHINNASYIRFLENALPPARFADSVLCELDVCYHREVKPEADISLRLTQENDRFYFAVQDGEATAFEACGRWE